MKAIATAAAVGLALLTTSVAAVAPQKPVIVSYPEDTPNWVLAKAKAAIVEMGGVITHEYNLIKGFAAMASEKALEVVEAQGQTNNVLVEQDQVVTANEA